ncbi:unnamed protein product [marine sediment metagenome]|uniref:Uncharacterized protein n=1 Tax=marine sediment metagenome TaxID=412755 RepID=X1CU66_9ZZZZ
MKVNDGAAKTLVSGIAEGANTVPGDYMILLDGWTITLRDESFVGGDTVTKAVLYWEMRVT